MSDEVLVLVGEDPQLVEGQDSAKTGCPSVMPKRLFGFSSSWWLSGTRVVKCGLDRWFERTGLKVCKRTKKGQTLCNDNERKNENQMCLAVY